MEIQPLPGMEGKLNPLDEAQLESDRARKIFEVSEDAGPWMDDYWALRAEGWPWRQAVYMIWASQPSGRRWPKTQWELATEILGLTSDRQIRKWKDDNPAIEVRVRKLTLSALAKARAEVIAALITSAADPNPRSHADRRMLMEITGDYVPKQRIAVGPDVPDEMEDLSREELQALAYEPKGTADGA